MGGGFGGMAGSLEGAGRGGFGGAGDIGAAEQAARMQSQLHGSASGAATVDAGGTMRSATRGMRDTAAQAEADTRGTMSDTRAVAHAAGRSSANAALSGQTSAEGAAGFGGGRANAGAQGSADLGASASVNSAGTVAATRAAARNTVSRARGAVAGVAGSVQVPSVSVSGQAAADADANVN
jgi:hypothetical protein